MTYSDWLTTQARAWAVANPERFIALRAGVWDLMRSFHELSAALPEKGSFRRTALDAATIEAIRKLNDWPSERRHEAGERLPV